MLNILGLDTSLTHTAGYHARVRLHDDATAPEVVGDFCGFALKSGAKDHAHPLLRLRAIRESFVRELQRCEPDDERLLITEGYSFGSVNSHSHALGELGGALRMAAFERGWDVVVVPPSSLKQYVCDKGNAPKELMLQQVLKRWGYEATDNNDCDAYALMQLGLDYVRDRAGAQLPKRTGGVLAKLQTWAAAA